VQAEANDAQLLITLSYSVRRTGEGRTVQLTRRYEP